MSGAESLRLAVLADAGALAAAAADAVATRIVAAVAGRGRARVVLAGGETPRRLYRLLAKRDLPWPAIDLVFGDERCVPPGDPRSNYAMVRAELLGRLSDPPAVHRIPAELGAEAGAARYAAELSRLVGAAAPEPLGEPAFDLVLLGLGADGHTASLFPGSPALDAAGWAAAAEAPADAPVRERVTLTVPALASARDMLLLVSGENKRVVLARVLRGDDLPAARVLARGCAGVLADAEAAGAR